MSDPDHKPRCARRLAPGVQSRKFAAERTVSPKPPAGGSVPSVPYVYPLTRVTDLLGRMPDGGAGPATWLTLRRMRFLYRERRAGFFDGLF